MVGIDRQWLIRHSDRWHPGPRRKCDHCQEIIRIYGYMPPADDILALAAEQRRATLGATKAHIPTGLRWQVWERDNFTCQHCGRRRFLSVDHIIPESHGGELVLENLQTLCTPCNSRKGAR